MTSPQSNDQSAPILKKIALTAKDNWTWAAPLVYLYVTAIGMTQSWLHFNAFQINVFDFAEINDFLLAAFRAPISFLYIVLLIVVLVSYSIFVMFLLHQLSSRKFLTSEGHPIARLLSRIGPILNFLIIISIFVLPPYFAPVMLNESYSTDWMSKYVKDPCLKFEALFRMPNDSLSTDQKFVSDLTLIGTTEKYMFFVKQTSGESDSYKVYISPISNVIQIRGDVESPVCDEKNENLQ